MEGILADVSWFADCVVIVVNLSSLLKQCIHFTRWEFGLMFTLFTVTVPIHFYALDEYIQIMTRIQ